MKITHFEHGPYGPCALVQNSSRAVTSAMSHTSEAENNVNQQQRKLYTFTTARWRVDRRRRRRSRGGAERKRRSREEEEDQTGGD